MAAATEKIDLTPSVHFAQHLAANEKKIRDRAVKKVTNWLKGRSMKDTGFTLEELLKLWKGFFYCMWMSDKMIVQEDLAGSLSQMIHCLQTPKQGLMFFEAFLEIMKRDLNGIDNLRLDKFLMLIRRTFCQTLVLLKKKEWAERKVFINEDDYLKQKHPRSSLVKSFLKILKKYPLNPDQDACPDSIRFFVIEIYIEELSRVGADELSEDQVLTFLEPLIELASLTRVKSINNAIMVQIFEEIVRQARVEADHEDHLEFIEEDHKRMKADGVKVFEELPMLEFDLQGICKLLFTHASKTDTLSRNRKRIYKTIALYRNLVKGIHPSQLIIAEKKEIKDSFLYLEKPWLKEKEEREKLRMKVKRENRRKRRKQKRIEAEGGLGEPQGGGGEDTQGGGREETLGQTDRETQGGDGAEFQGGGDGSEEGEGELSKDNKSNSEGGDIVRGNEGNKTKQGETDRTISKAIDDMKTREDDDDEGRIKVEEKMGLDEEVRLQPPKAKRQLRRSKRNSGVERRGQGTQQEGLDRIEAEQSLEVETNDKHVDTLKATSSQESVPQLIPEKEDEGRRKVKDDLVIKQKKQQQEKQQQETEEKMEISDADVGGEVMEKQEMEMPELLGDGRKEKLEAEKKRGGRKRESKVEISEADALSGKKKKKQSLRKKQVDGTDSGSQSDVFSDAYSPPVTRKRVSIALAKNQESSTADYQRRVTASPGIPFDKMKKPEQPAIKPSPSPPKRITRSLRKRREKNL